MLTSMKSSATEKDRNAAANAPDVMGRVVQPHDQPWARSVCGRVKGTIRAVRVKLQNGGAVEGDIFHRSLSIDENSQFEGSSRRVENPTEPSSSVDAKGPQKSPQKKDLAPAPLPSIDAELTDSK